MSKAKKETAPSFLRILQFWLCHCVFNIMFLQEAKTKPLLEKASYRYARGSPREAEEFSEELEVFIERPSWWNKDRG